MPDPLISMFTGIIEEVGVITAINKTGAGLSLTVKAHNITVDIKLGDSIAIDGVCLSVTHIKGNQLTFDVIQETIRRTTLGTLKMGDDVNIERSLRMDSRLNGHFVSGHIDYKGKIEEIQKGAKGVRFTIPVPNEFSRFIVEKGSIALDGVSLTVGETKRDNFTVYLIPHTLKETTLSRKRKGDKVNIETDLLAKYLIKRTDKPNLQDLLQKYGYIS